MDQLITLRTLPVSALMQKDFRMIKGSCTVAEALQIMKTGSKWRLFVPPALAYGTRRFGRIAPNSVLIFDMELLSIETGGLPGPHDLNPGEAGDEGT